MAEKCEAVEQREVVCDVMYCSPVHHIGIVLCIQGYIFLSGVCVLCTCKHKPCGRRSNTLTHISVNLCLQLRPLIGQSLVAVLAETEDSQHVSPLLPSQRVCFVQRRQLTERRQRGVSHINTPVQHSSYVSTAVILNVLNVLNVLKFITAIRAWLFVCFASGALAV